MATQGQDTVVVGDQSRDGAHTFPIMHTQLPRSVRHVHHVVCLVSASETAAQVPYKLFSQAQPVPWCSWSLLGLSSRAPASIMMATWLLL